MTGTLPVLAILPLNCLVLHEYHDESRTIPLVAALEASHVLRNPPIVTPLHDHTARYMVLDGANRTTALKRMGIPHTLAQVVETDRLGVEAQTWNHVIWDLPQDDFLQGIEAIPGVELHRVAGTEDNHQIARERALVVIHLPTGEVYEAHIPAVNASERNRLLNAVVDSYKHRAKMDRTGVQEIDPLRSYYPSLSGLVIMPVLKINQVLHLAGNGHLLPGGVTRFTISPRALRVHYPLSELKAEKSLEEKNAALNDWLQSLLARKVVRFYEEATVLFDE